jgi:hypothetical protein
MGRADNRRRPLHQTSWLRDLKSSGRPATSRQPAPGPIGRRRRARRPLAEAIEVWHRRGRTEIVRIEALEREPILALSVLARIRGMPAR